MSRISPERSRRGRRIAAILLGTFLVVLLMWKVVYPAGFSWYAGVKMPAIDYGTEPLSEEAFEALAVELAGEFEALPYADAAWMKRGASLDHVARFRDAGIREYEGPQTCLTCHRTMTVHDGTAVREVDTLHDVLDTVHYRLHSMSPGFSTVGYDGREVDGPGTRAIPVGKIDRACGIPGSFTFTGWAALVPTTPEEAHGETVLRSEGCGQCHIGGQYGPPTETMLPGLDTPREAWEAIDCLICHAADYDMNEKYVVADEYGTRWNQDRTLRSALTVGRPTTEACLRCHQHNMGGDTYRWNPGREATGYENARLLHASAKRGNPYGPEDDVHAEAGLDCLQCHTSVGHKVARGLGGTDLVSNDLPGVDVSCERCHTDQPHLGRAGGMGAEIDRHTSFIACETCHITGLRDENVVLRDWVKPTWNAEEGLWTPSDIFSSGDVRMAVSYLWWNGQGTFLANALGSPPGDDGSWNPLMDQMIRFDDPAVRAAIRSGVEKAFAGRDIDVDTYLENVFDTLTQITPAQREQRIRMIEENLRPVMQAGHSKIYPFKLFNARMYEDMANQGPFGAMILPFDYSVYATGRPKQAVEQALANTMVKRMYELPFDLYMMDEFMAYFGVDGWTKAYPLKERNRANVEDHWMRQMGTLKLSHGIRREGFACETCHSEPSLLDRAALKLPGY
jgi:hypothetical protein